MNVFLINQLVVDLLTVLGAGFLSGVICKRSGVSLLVGYLVVGAIIGEGAQLGEFSFLLIAEGLREGVIRAEDYNRMLFIALGTLILTPQLLKLGLRWTGGLPDEAPKADTLVHAGAPIEKAIVVGIGPTGRQIASSPYLLAWFAARVFGKYFSKTNSRFFRRRCLVHRRRRPFPPVANRCGHQTAQRQLRAAQQIEGILQLASHV